MFQPFEATALRTGDAASPSERLGQLWSIKFLDYRLETAVFTYSKTKTKIDLRSIATVSR
jgi:hypothetical protein